MPELNPLPAIDPQPCRGRLRDNLWDHPEWWAEHKLHGCRYLLYSDGRLLSRHASVKGTGYVNKIDRTPHFAEAAKWLPKGTVLDGEVVSHDFGTVRDVTSILGSDPEIALLKQEERGWLKFRVFDLPFMEGVDWRREHLEERRMALEAFFARVHLPHISLLEKVHYNKKAFYDNILVQGGEGIILKWQYALYGQQRYWVKAKGTEEYDVFILGYKPASEMSTKVSGITSVTKFAAKGWIGAVEMGMYVPLGDGLGGGQISVGYCSGFDEATRQEISENQEAFFGRVFEIRAQSQLESGKFEHPRFVRWRDDKGKEDCIYEGSLI